MIWNCNPKQAGLLFRQYPNSSVAGAASCRDVCRHARVCKGMCFAAGCTRGDKPTCSFELIRFPFVSACSLTLQPFQTKTIDVLGTYECANCLR